MAAAKPANAKSRATPAAQSAPPAPPATGDAFLAMLLSQLQPVLTLDPGAASAQAQTELAAQLGQLAPARATTTTQAECAGSPGDIAQACNQHDLDFAGADIARDKALASAQADFRDGLTTWRSAVAQYRFTVANAQAVLNSAAKDAQTAYVAKANSDSSPPRTNYLVATAQDQVAGAIQINEQAAATAASVLAGEAGNVFAAYATLNGAIATAQAAHLVAQAGADQAFWLSVDQIRDAT